MEAKISISFLDSLLRGCEGKPSAFFDKIAESNSADRALILHLVSLAESGDPHVQVAATALLKRFRVKGVDFPTAVIGRLLDLLPSVARWECRLHILQLIPTFSIPQTKADDLLESLMRILQERNAFVRAWTYGGLHHLASVYPEFRVRVVPLLRRAARKEPASVRARLRRLPPLELSTRQRKQSVA